MRLLWGTVVGLLFIAGSPATAADRYVEILDFYVYPDEASHFNKLAGYTWPEVEALNALVEVDVGGYAGEQKIDLFMVVLDEEEEVVSKLKGKHWLPAGEHELLFPEFLRTDAVFGVRSFQLKIEVALKGVKPVYEELWFDVEGPDPPDVDILDIQILDPVEGGRGRRFTPGDEFVAEAIIDIEDNESSVKPQVLVFAMMEEDWHLIDPEMNYQPYDAHWDQRALEVSEGVYELRARGRLPYYFAEPYRFAHDWRVYVIVDFGPGVVTSDYARAELWDHNNGDHRASEELADRLIELDRAYRWEVRRLRGERPDTDSLWN